MPLTLVTIVNNTCTESIWRAKCVSYKVYPPTITKYQRWPVWTHHSCAQRGWLWTQLIHILSPSLALAVHRSCSIRHASSVPHLTTSRSFGLHLCAPFPPITVPKSPHRTLCRSLHIPTVQTHHKPSFILLVVCNGSLLHYPLYCKRLMNYWLLFIALDIRFWHRRWAPPTRRSHHVDPKHQQFVLLLPISRARPLSFQTLNCAA